MGISEDISRLLDMVLARYDGNKSAAAKSLGVNEVTFWGWIEKKRSFNPALCSAIDKAGGRLVIPGDLPSNETTDDVRSLKERIQALEKDKEKLERNLIRTEGRLDELREQILRLVPTPTPPQATNREDTPERKNENVT